MKKGKRKNNKQMQQWKVNCKTADVKSIVSVTTSSLNA
jgi:hypothetical protein